MERLIVSALVVLALMLAPSPARAEDHGGPSPGKSRSSSKGSKKIDGFRYPPLVWKIPEVGKEVRREKLDNGMTVYLMEDAQVPLVDVAVVFRTGTAAEDKAQHGIADLAASLLRTGGTASRTPDQVNEELEFLGARLSSSSSTESALVSLNLLARDLDKGLDIMMDVLRHPEFSQEKLDIMKGQMRERLLRKNDSASEVAMREFFKKLFSDHPYGWGADLRWPVIKAITRDDLVRWHAARYRPGNAFVAVSGSFKADELLARLNATLGAWKAEAPAAMEIPPVKELEGGAYFVQKELDQSIIYLGHLGTDRYNPDRYALEVMNFILGGGSFNSRLMSKIRSDEGLAYTVYSQFRTDFAKGGAFWAFCQTKCDSTYKALDLMLREIVRMRESPVTDAELRFARESLVNSFIFTFEDSASIVRNLAYLEYDGLQADYYKTYIEKIKAVTAADVQRVARQYLHPDKLVYVVVGDRSRLKDQLRPLGEVREIPLEDLTD